ncbi:MAG: hypothetical protein IGR80_15495 [Synechococcales cyanobacterium K44_A2020_017]|jgi:hypothetical protein|uniref:hypothetical protein n=1 Tax=Leptolyngbya sp. CCY15150 TaxID=2767772 RepID=UPI00194FE8E3|nr:hypothetical protein [Leptolyngbya sp. CCY15150]MBF2089925.1 hypothetical protein [Synechococcales cyanobacterium K32_A2020_035]MBF2096146.1 hypothetical protein [Synechococcales cyanobacterium K44_A2020_017]
MHIAQRTLLLGLAVTGLVATLQASVPQAFKTQSLIPDSEVISNHDSETVYRGSGRREILAFPGGDRLVQDS